MFSLKNGSLKYKKRGYENEKNICSFDGSLMCGVFCAGGTQQERGFDPYRQRYSGIEVSAVNMRSVCLRWAML